ncbi:serine hydrolase, partial [Desulfovibrio desulfuricans]|uniref:serine hydrolase n=1 Tax=Desulfovibrio desulfuricans TaxID=876 RepID=UPI0023B02519
TTFRLDRWEVELNTAIPGDARETTTPLAMRRTLNGLLCGNQLKAPARKQLTDWMLGCATGAGRIPAGAPQGWLSAHKSGSGEHGTANDVGVLLPPGNPEQAAKARNGQN